MAWLLVHAPPDSPLPPVLEALLAPEEAPCRALADPFSALADREARTLLLAAPLDAETRCAFLLARRRLRPDLRVVCLARSRDEALSSLRLGASEVLPDGLDVETLAERVRRWKETTSAGGAAPPTGDEEEGDEEEEEKPAADLDALSLFVRGLAHEVNNPLTTIRGFLQLLLHDEGTSTPEEARDAYRTMEAETRRIAEVIQELEYFSGLRRPARTLVDIAAVLDEVARQVGPERVECGVDESVGAVLADREQIRVALAHLVGYLAGSSADSEVRVRVRVRRRGQRVLVEADGPNPTPPEHPDRLLVPLHPAHARNGERKSLAAVFGIARAHGGALSVETRGDRLLLRFDLPSPRSGPPSDPSEA